MVQRGRAAVNKLTHPLRRSARNPFAGPRHKLLHAAHHRVGTVWFSKVLREVAGTFGLRFHYQDRDAPLDRRADVIVLPHSFPDPNGLGDIRGSHMIRDPRDVVVSGYFYHRWTKEQWALKPRERWGNKSYQDHLLSLEQDEGIAVEMRRFVLRSLPRMLAWDYERPGFLEMRYEEVIADEVRSFTRLFRHYGFHDEAVDRAVAIAETMSFDRVAKRSLGEVQEGSHLRSGKAGQWRSVFSPEHVALFKELAAPALIKLGYESDDRW